MKVTKNIEIHNYSKITGGFENQAQYWQMLSNILKDK